MSTEQLKGNLEQLKGKIKQKWGSLTDNEIESIKGDAHILAGKLVERYGMMKDKAEQEANEFLKSCNGHDKDSDPINALKEKFTKTADDVKDNIQEASENIIDYIKAKPMTSMAIALAAGVALALITSR